MNPFSLKTITEFCDGRLVAGDPAMVCSSVNTDSRKIQPGELFFALVGENFDAHDFIPQVALAGAAAIVVNRVPENVASLPCAVIAVEDTLLALQTLARRHRELTQPLVVGITGSNGKTSTKDFLAAIMRQKFQVGATLGNLNNHIGLPITMLRMKEGDNCGIFEMGMNHAGEIEVLASIAQPDAAIITNIGVAHIEYLGTRENIALEKGMLVEAVPANGLVVLNANDDFSASLATRSKGKTLLAGVSRGDVSATIRESSVQGSTFTLDFSGANQVEVSLPIPGEHMVGNATLAAACAWHYGVSPEKIADVLSKVEITKGRLQVKHLHGVTFLDDSYNANPDSVRAGLKTLAEMPVSGRRIAVLGRMGELGAHAESGHREVGEFAARMGLDAVFTVGEEASIISEVASRASQKTEAKHFRSHADCSDYLMGWLKKDDAVLLKGSRSSGMEKILTPFEKE
ncbi:UDP-N-acetylmuramoyl-tripeptide--D-alanyl-D-alanine ligase [soil metagenome]